MTMYNAATHLRAAVESILNQTMRDFELIIVDDGSTDESVALLKNWDDPRIRLIQNPLNKGQTICLNQGLALARGNWVARQDADDISLPSRLETQINAVTKNPGLTLIGSQAWIIDHAGKFEGTLNLPLEMESLEWASLFENPFVHTAVMYRRDQITNLGGYDESFAICQDYELWLRVLQMYRGVNLSARLVQYRHTAQSLSQSGRSTVDAESLRVRAALWDRIFADSHFSASDKWAFLQKAGPSLGEDSTHFDSLSARVRAHYLQSRPNLIRSRDFRRTTALEYAQIGRNILAKHRFAGACHLARGLTIDPKLLLDLAKDRVLGPWSFSR
jgi:hypothetical protein